MMAKVRPCLVLSVPVSSENERDLITLVSHTTRVRGSQFEVSSDARFLKEGCFDTQNLITIPSIKLVRLLGKIRDEQLATIELAIKRWLGLDEDE